MDNTETSAKRGRPATVAEQSHKNRRDAVALAVLQSALNNREVTNPYELVRYCFVMADIFIEVADDGQ
jgi:hypothetical protein